MSLKQKIIRLAKSKPVIFENEEFNLECETIYPECGECRLNTLCRSKFMESKVKLSDVVALLDEAYNDCAYVDSDGKPAFLCTTCGFYHGMRKGCSWKVDRQKIEGCRFKQTKKEELKI